MLDLSARKVYGALAEQCVGGDAKADKVENATSGHLAGLDSNGNLTDSGVSPTEDVTVEGNPVTFDSPFEQDAKSVVVTVKPIQSGSGTPSPENIRPISGIDEVEIDVSDGEGTPTTTTIPLPSTMYGGDVDVTNGSGDENKALKVLSSSDNWMKITEGVPSGRNVYFLNSVLPNSQSAVDDNNSGHVVMKSSVFDIGQTSFNTMKSQTAFSIGIGSFGDNSTIGINTDIDNLQDFKDWVDSAGIQIMYELATPTTISFDPTDVELLEGTNVVSTNGEKVAVTYGRSLWQDIDDLKTDTEDKLDKSDVATIEGDTASKAYSVNDFMLRSDGFYKVTQPIAQNASITASNTTKTTVGEVLTALLNA